MNNIILNDNEKEEEKKLLIKLKKELDYLSDYNNFKKINKKIKIKRLITKILSLIKYNLPYEISFILLFIVFTLLNNNSFFNNKIKKEAYTKKTIDNNKKITYMKEYKEIVFNKLVYYSKWYINKENEYERDIITYALYNMNEDEIINIINNYDNINIDRILYRLDEKKEIKKTINKEDNNEIVIATLYFPLENDYIIIKDNCNNKIDSKLLFVTYFIIISLLIYLSNEYNHKINLKEILRRIDDRYSDLTIEEYKEILDIKESNYRRLTR